ncbi:hypothetical protein [Suttonella ornithocola]|uniref:Uncharacterized protein n=1 Tax=Suttonella ornithocola TaxID=279832 RepID=A0A380MP48_9GAMM|nr:hypothetical protein [Suttonella ornithocola]SUO94048.1 Uncharacterised protein [Suttonella ornithocola]
MEFLFRILLSASSVSLLPIIYYIKERRNVFSILIGYVKNHKLNFMLNDICLIAYFLIPLLLVSVVFMLIPKLSKDDINNNNIVDIENQVNHFLPTYLGYIFIALSISDDFMLWIIFFMVSLFTFISQDNYFNPIFLLFGYKFYKIKKSDGFSYLLISKLPIKKASDIEEGFVYRINNYTFIQR